LCRRAHAHRVQDTADDRVRGTPLDGTPLGGLLLLHQLYGLVVARRMEAVLVKLGHLVAQLLDLPLKAALAEVDYLGLQLLRFGAQAGQRRQAAGVVQLNHVALTERLTPLSLALAANRGHSRPLVGRGLAV